jgi:aspartyl protease family protein
LKLADGAPTVPLRTAEGLVQVHIARVQSLELEGARADDVEVAIVPSLPEGAEGVLGLGFLARFDMKVDGQAGQLVLSERKPLEPAARN